MSSKSYKTIVGLFVLGGLALFAAGVILLGSGKIFSNALEYTMYFNGSVSGLSVGAPVVFRGVPMGSVTHISLVASSRDNNITIPVTVSIDDSSFIRPNGERISEEGQALIIHKMIEHGLRARLQMASLITGQSRVELDFFPNSPINYRSSDPEWEIPTVPSPIDTLQRTLARLPLEQIADSLTSILHNISDAVGEGQIQAALNKFGYAFDSMGSFFTDPAVRKSFTDVMSQVDKATRSIQIEIPGAIASFTEAMQGLAKVSSSISKVANSAEYAVGRDSPTMNDLRRLLKDAAAAARSLKNFADMLERNPEALLKGRQGTR